MYQSASYPPSFLIKQALFAIFVAWFCCSLLLITTQPQFFDVDYKTLDISNSTPLEDSYNIKISPIKGVLVFYDKMAHEISELLGKIAEFVYVMVGNISYSELIVSSAILLIPFFVSFVVVMSISNSIAAERVVLLSVVNCVLLIFTVIFNVFAGAYYGYESLQVTPLQVSSYALLNTIIFFLLFSLCLFLLSFKKSKNEK